MTYINTNVEVDNTQYICNLPRRPAGAAPWAPAPARRRPRVGAAHAAAAVRGRGGQLNPQ